MLTLLLTLALVTGQAETPIPVYVTSAGAVDGMTDPDKGRAETVRDIKDQVGRKRSFSHTPSIVLTHDREAARVVVVVTGRDASGSIGAGAGRDRVIRVTLHYGQHEAELTAARAGGAVGSAGAWRDAAGKLVKQLDQWVKDNRAQLAR